MADKHIADIHIVLASKGGVGKSFIASLLAQYFSVKNMPPICVDTDPLNSSFSSYKAFEVHPVKIMEGDSFNTRVFDDLMEDILLPAKKGDRIVIDNGSATFVPLCSYFAENDVIQLLEEAGHRVFIHSVLTGGQAATETMIGLRDMCKAFTCPIVVWLNEYFGSIEKGGVLFEDSKTYEEYSERIHAILRIEKRNPVTFGRDLEELMSSYKTFAEAMRDPSIQIVHKNRLKKMSSAFFESLDGAQIHG